MPHCTVYATCATLQWVACITIESMPCPTCGATDGFVLDADGKVSSCKSCDETRERNSRKDQIDSDALKKAAREPVKDAVDLGLKAAGVVVAAGVLLKKLCRHPTVAFTNSTQ